MWSPSPQLPADGCFTATYAVPDNDAFWSITVYNADGYMFSDKNNLNSAGDLSDPANVLITVRR